MHEFFYPNYLIFLRCDVVVICDVHVVTDMLLDACLPNSQPHERKTVGDVDMIDA